MLLLAQARATPARRGSALLMAFLVLIVLAAILFQLYIGTTTDARVARNDVTLTSMDQTIESALLEVYDRLLTDAESAAAAGGAGGAGAAAAGMTGMGDPGAAAPAAAGAPGGNEPSDSREDSWGRVQRTTINEIELRILVQDEDSKLNVLSVLTENEEQADAALERVARVLDLCREDTSVDIDRSDARRMAQAMRDHFKSRSTSVLPRAEVLSDDDEQVDVGLPLSLREMVVIEPFHEGLFRDFRDDRGRIVHSIGSYLTVWTSLQPLADTLPPEEPSAAAATPPPGGNDPPAGGAGAPAPGGEAPEAGPSGGVAVNINTAPAAVLKSLVDDRTVPYRFWDEVIEYRNLEEEKTEEEKQTAAEPVYDEYGEEVYTRKFFDSVDELEELGTYSNLGAEDRLELSQLIGTQSHVFSIYVTARRSTGRQDDFGGVLGAPQRGVKEDQLGNAVTRTVRSVVWRYQDGDEWKIVPLVRWEVIDYTPFEVLDFPDPDR
jgi:hypothetical protein